MILTHMAALFGRVRLQMHYLRTIRTWKSKAYALAQSPDGLRLHVGCGSEHLPNMLNCDSRITPAVDVVMDCSRLHRFANEQAHLIFANAFFEHLYQQQHLPFLRDCRRVLDASGVLILLAIPDFAVIAHAYVDRVPGIVAPIFDYSDVYRYTHGNPEQAQGWWLGQLHKYIYDRFYVESLLTKSGFAGYHLFNYCYPGETIPLNLGVIAWKGTRPDAEAMLPPFKKYISSASWPPVFS